MATCKICGADFEQNTGRGRRTLYCSDECRKVRVSNRSYPKRLTCAGCDQPIYKGSTSLPQGEARCRRCRISAAPERLDPQAVRERAREYARASRTPCADCGAPAYGARCWECRYLDCEGPDRAKRLQLQQRRRDREKAAPGLTLRRRRRLLAKWIQQGRRCAYCLALGTQVDHVLPLALGGTNYEGNLAPCCAACNARKNDSLLIEWRFKQMALTA